MVFFLQKTITFYHLHNFTQFFKQLNILCLKPATWQQDELKVLDAKPYRGENSTILCYSEKTYGYLFELLLNQYSGTH